MKTNYQERLARVKQAIDSSDAVLIGAGAGLSSAAGLLYSGKRFTDNFPDYIERYQLTDMYSSAFYPFKTPEEKWGYFSRHIKLNRFDFQAGKVYADLLQIVKDKQYFVITTNADALFYKAGFDPAKIFATQGEYAKFQCQKACHDTLYDNEEMVTHMVEEQSDCRIPSELIPICPVCGGPLVPHLRIDSFFVENDEWRAARDKYSAFVRDAYGSQFLLFEIGVGYNTPVIIKYPFEKFTAENEQAILVRINRDAPEASEMNRKKTITFSEETCEILEFLAREIKQDNPTR